MPNEHNVNTYQKRDLALRGHNEHKISFLFILCKGHTQCTVTVTVTAAAVFQRHTRCGPAWDVHTPGSYRPALEVCDWAHSAACNDITRHDQPTCAGCLQQQAQQHAAVVQCAAVCALLRQVVVHQEPLLTEPSPCQSAYHIHHVTS
jgi:hypothetical protein